MRSVSDQLNSGAPLVLPLHACSTPALFTVHVEIDVLTHHSVPVLTIGTLQRPTDVLLVSHGFHMVGVYAGPVLAQVVNREAIRNRIFKPMEDQPLRAILLGFLCNTPINWNALRVAILLVESPCPSPTFVRYLDLRPHKPQRFLAGWRKRNRMSSFLVSRHRYSPIKYSVSKDSSIASGQEGRHGGCLSRGEFSPARS